MGEVKARKLHQLKCSHHERSAHSSGPEFRFNLIPLKDRESQPERKASRISPGSLLLTRHPSYGNQPFRRT